VKQATIDLFTRIFAVLAPPPDHDNFRMGGRIPPSFLRIIGGAGPLAHVKGPISERNHGRNMRRKHSESCCNERRTDRKTDGFILNPIGYFMHYDPSPIMVLQPTIQMAETFSKDRLSPMLRDTPVLRDRVNDKARNSGNTILQKIFPGGHVTMVGANSPSSLASRPIRILLADEIDRYPATAGNEGDPTMSSNERSTLRT